MRRSTPIAPYGCTQFSYFFHCHTRRQRALIHFPKSLKRERFSLYNKCNINIDNARLICAELFKAGLLSPLYLSTNLLLSKLMHSISVPPSGSPDYLARKERGKADLISAAVLYQVRRNPHLNLNGFNQEVNGFSPHNHKESSVLAYT